MFFFFQAEDGIRDKLVTGVQTCALPICFDRGNLDEVLVAGDGFLETMDGCIQRQRSFCGKRDGIYGSVTSQSSEATRESRRSEERRVGKECRSGWAADHQKKKRRSKTVK